MSSIFSRLSGLEPDLERQIAQLSTEVSALRNIVSAPGGAEVDGAWETGADLYDDMRDRFSTALPYVRKGARTVERSARDHPATAAAVGLVVVGLMVALTARRQS